MNECWKSSREPEHNFICDAVKIWLTRVYIQSRVINTRPSLCTCSVARLDPGARWQVWMWWPSCREVEVTQPSKYMPDCFFSLHIYEYIYAKCRLLIPTEMYLSYCLSCAVAVHCQFSFIWFVFTLSSRAIWAFFFLFDFPNSTTITRNGTTFFDVCSWTIRLHRIFRNRLNVDSFNGFKLQIKKYFADIHYCAIIRNNYRNIDSILWNGGFDEDFADFNNRWSDCFLNW